MAQDIFDLAVSGFEKDFIKKGLQLEGEVASDILAYLGELPWLGSLIKLGKVGAGFIDLHFVYKIAKFLQQSEDIADEEKEKFLQKLDEKQRKKMYEYLMHFLYAAESAEKAELMGFVYRERILNHIDDSLFLRLCSVIKNSFVEDLKFLGEYVELNDRDDYITDNLVSLGLLLVPAPSFDGKGAMNLESRHILNSTGKSLYQILKSYNWSK